MLDIKQEVRNRFSLPSRISRLGELAYNLWWVWNPEAQKLFSQIDINLWDEVHHNPVMFLDRVDRASLNAASNDRNYLKVYDQVFVEFDEYISADKTWFTEKYSDMQEKEIAYFSFEFGLHESLPVYAGGLGVLSGDHLKEASDLGMPILGVGFIYRQGYFSQHISEDGWQETRNFYLNLDSMPVLPLSDENGDPLTISVQLPGREVHARLWEVQVGRVSLYLLDSDMDKNSTTDRQLTARLYSNDLEVRISQEILLGLGGAKALKLLGHKPDVWHMNEGHSAFLSLQRLIDMVQEDGLSYEDAVKEIRKSNVFTTHTPVPAGIDQFPLWMMDKYFSYLWPEMKLSRDEFIDLGRHAQQWGENFSMPVLALKLSEYANGVSQLHGRVSRKMFNFLWPKLDEGNVPISHVTNGVHVGSWMAQSFDNLYKKYFGADWIENADDPSMWDKIYEIPDDELWFVHQQLKDDMIGFINKRARKQWLTNKYHPVQVIAGGVLLDKNALTLGFARRFATYKRAYLLLEDFDRMLNIINNVDRPVQIIFSGKAHPADEAGKLIIQQIYRAVKDARTGGRLVFLEDYDMNVARYLVQGVDLWVNTPRRPNEASGTSGMKAAMNGVMNFSIMDGWWREGFNGENGWKIGDETTHEDAAVQDKSDANDFYSTLENEIVPLFYNDQYMNIPSSDWIGRMKESTRTLTHQFSMKRMVKEYGENLYLPALTKK